MHEPAEKVKIQRTRKRIYEMQHDDAPENEVLQEPVVAVAVSTTDVATEVIEAAKAVVPDAVTAVEAVVLYAQEPEKKCTEECVSEQLLQDMLASEEVQEPAAERELSAMEIAAMEFAAEAAEISRDSSEQIHDEKGEPFQSAMTTVYKYSAISAATGLIPVPLVDMAGFMATQLLMLRKLCKIYDIPFDTQRSKSAIAILASGINSAYLAASTSKLIPFIGAFTMAAMPAVNGALSYAVGRVFIQHFESGGTFLDFDPHKVRGYFEEQYRASKLSRSGKSNDATS